MYDCSEILHYWHRAAFRRKINLRLFECMATASVRSSVHKQCHSVRFLGNLRAPRTGLLRPGETVTARTVGMTEILNQVSGGSRIMVTICPGARSRKSYHSTSPVCASAALEDVRSACGLLSRAFFFSFHSSSSACTFGPQTSSPACNSSYCKTLVGSWKSDCLVRTKLDMHASEPTATPRS